MKVAGFGNKDDLSFFDSGVELSCCLHFLRKLCKSWSHKVCKFLEEFSWEAVFSWGLVGGQVLDSLLDFFKHNVLNELLVLDLCDNCWDTLEAPVPSD